MDVVARRRRSIRRAICMGLSETKRKGEPWQGLENVVELLFERDAIVIEQVELHALIEALVVEEVVQKQLLGDAPMYRRP